MPRKVILASEMEKDMVKVEELTPLQKLDIIIAFHECYGNTVLDTADFASEFYHLVNFIHSGYLPTKLSWLVDWEDTLIEWYPKYQEILKKPNNKQPVSSEKQQDFDSNFMPGEAAVMDLIIFAVREGYEIKVWLKDVPADASNEHIVNLAKKEYKRVGIVLRENETFEWEQF